MADDDAPLVRTEFRARPGESWVLVSSREGAARRYLAPRTFTAATTLDNGVEIRIEVEVDAQGVPRCTALDIRGDRGIDGGTLREVPVARIVREALGNVAMPVREQSGATLRADLPTQK